MSLHSKHFTHAFQRSVCFVWMCTFVHPRRAHTPERVCACVWVCGMTVVWNLTPGASWIHEGPLSCPLPIRCQTWIVLPESSASLWQIFTRLLKNIKQAFLWMGAKHWRCVAGMCYGVSQTPAACPPPTPDKSEKSIQNSRGIHMKSLNTCVCYISLGITNRTDLSFSFPTWFCSQLDSSFRGQVGLSLSGLHRTEDRRNRRTFRTQESRDTL